jgi:predicted Zn-dependent protease
VLLGPEDAPPEPDARARRAPDVLLTDADDARAGREASGQIAAAMGLLGDPSLDAYVTRVGQRLLRTVPGRGFDWTFVVVDQPEPNAFALPGGHVFVTRGLLALVQDEDELANVIGHEIVHALRRHAARQQALDRAQSPVAMPWIKARQLAAYSRDMEREADRHGQLLAAAAGYDPEGMASFMTRLGKATRLARGTTERPGWFDTHPGTGERAAANAVRAREIRWTRAPALGDTRQTHLAAVEGLPLGERPENGVFEGERFVHPVLDFQVRFPDGWRTANTPRAVGAAAPRGDSVVFLTVDLPPGPLPEVAEAFVAKTAEELGEAGRVTVRSAGPARVGRLEAWQLDLDVQAGGSLRVLATLFPYTEATWRFMGVSPARSADTHRFAMQAVLRSFRPVAADQRAALRTTRLDVVEARPGESLEALSRRAANAWSVPLTAVSNDLAADHRFTGGEPVKVAREEPWAPAAPRP